MELTKIKFSFETEFGPFTDCISYSANKPWTDEQIEAEKQQRLDAWLKMANPVVEPSAPV